MDTIASNITNKPRFEFIDLAKGICIIMVVFHHLCGNYINTDSRFYIMLYSIRMPLYFILSGMFFSHYSNIIEFCIKKTNKLLVPFLFFSLVTVPFFLIKEVIPNGIQWTYGLHHLLTQSFVLNLPIWFLMCLFIDGLLFYLVSSISRCTGTLYLFVLSIISLLIGIAGYQFGVSHINLPLWTDTAMTAFPFYSFGYLLRSNTAFLQTKKLDEYLIPLFIVSIAFCFAFGQKAIFVSNAMDGCSLSLMYLSGIIGTFGILCLAKKIRIVKYISFFGRYSICILVTHYLVNRVLITPVIQWISTSFSCDIVICSIIAFVVLMFLYPCIIHFMTRYLGYFCAQKDVFAYVDGKAAFAVRIACDNKIQ